MRDAGLMHGGQLRPDLGHDWAVVQEVQAGGLGQQGEMDLSVWDQAPPGDHISNRHDHPTAAKVLMRPGFQL